MDEHSSQADYTLVSNDNIAKPHGAAAIPVLPGDSQLVELFTDFRDGAAAAFALAQIPRGGQILWVQERMAAMEMGRPFGQAFERFGGDADQLVLACSRNAGELLWAMEEGLRCSSLSAVIGEIYGDPRVLDFTATKRLAMRAERQGVHVFLIRINGAPNLSAARQRWNIASIPSAPHPWDDKAPGAPRWRAELFRARGMKPGVWEAGYDSAAHRIDLVSPLRDSALADEGESEQADRAVGSR